MNPSYTAIFAATVLAGAAACSGQRMPPKALVDARADYFRAKDGPAVQLDPTHVHEAEIALDRAERAWQESPSDPTAVDLALIADRKALLAEAEAATIQAQREIARARGQLEANKTSELKTAKGALSQTQQALGQTQMQLQDQERQTATLETKLKEARDTIAKIASVKDDERGMVITLPGEVLYKTGSWDLKPAAMAKLDQIAQVLKDKEQPIVVYGFTDTVGTRDNNMSLSQKRASAVRDYLVSKGVPQDLITAQGKGPDDPVADNNSVEGRAQNRRVEIVVQPKR
ncbi:MAG TPA: prefoldin subunit [Polyangiaceae bacterium]|jgi:outer membrane protein OmpA-like peptidoglycan-associated protein|nr:prefoldin subunit [Polyangiaceae bacterium]